MLRLFFLVLFMIPFLGFAVGDLFLVVSFLFLFGFSGLFIDYYMFNDFMGMDSVSSFLVLLSFIVCYLMVYSSFYVKFLGVRDRYFIMFIYWLMIFLLIRFYVVNVIGFYFFFEASLIPIFVLVMG